MTNRETVTLGEEARESRGELGVEVVLPPHHVHMPTHHDSFIPPPLPIPSIFPRPALTLKLENLN